MNGTTDNYRIIGILNKGLGSILRLIFLFETKEFVFFPINVKTFMYFVITAFYNGHSI